MGFLRPALALALTLLAVHPVNAADEPAAPADHSFWHFMRGGQWSATVRYRAELFDRDGAPFSAAALASTARLAVGYRTLEFHGFSLFAEAAGVAVIGPRDYSVPTLRAQSRPDRPAILDPQNLMLNQLYLKWTHTFAPARVSVTAGRQELQLNDGRFVSMSLWRQNHETFDAAKLNLDLPHNLGFTYAYLNRFYRVVSHDAIDGKPAMNSHMFDAAWKLPARLNLSLYSLLLDYRAPADRPLSTATTGLRLSGPWRIDKTWAVLYTAEYAKQRSHAANPNRVDANYYLFESGLSRRSVGVKAGYAWLGGRSATDKMTTPLANPFNGWTDFFVNVPSLGSSHGLEARYLTASAPLRVLGGATATLTGYDYHSTHQRIHYGNELDFGLAYKVHRVSERWEIGGRLGWYVADRLFTHSVRTSIYTSFTL